MRKPRITLLGLALLTCGTAAAQGDPTTAEAPERKKELVLPLGVTYSVFGPISGKTKNTFGHQWGGVGGTLFVVHRSQRWAGSFDLNVHLKGRGANDAALVAVTAGLERAVGGTHNVQPYVSARIGPYYRDLKFDRRSSRSVGFNANFGVGIVFYQRIFIEGRYDYFTRAAGFDFSGWSLTVGARVYDFKIRR